MVRKRSRYTRGRAKRGRPETPAPKAGWLIAELAELTRTPVRTIRYYVELGLLQPSEFRGTATRYQRRELLRLFVILRARTEVRLTLPEIKERLHTLSEPELEAWLLRRPLPPALATLLAAPTTPATAAAAQIADGSIAALQRPLVESWQRIPLASGLELMVRANASAEVHSAALRICADYLGKCAPDEQGSRALAEENHRS